MPDEPTESADHKVIYVSPAQVMAANLLIMLDKEDGKTTDPAVIAIAEAKTENER